MVSEVLVCMFCGVEVAICLFCVIRGAGFLVPVLWSQRCSFWFVGFGMSDVLVCLFCAVRGAGLTSLWYHVLVCQLCSVIRAGLPVLLC